MTIKQLLEMGKKYKENGYSLYEMEFDLVSKGVDYEDTKIVKLGYDGTEELIYVKGWRYGEFTDGGVSRNHQSGKCEYGLSMMEVQDMDGNTIEEARKASALFQTGKEIVWAEGWYTSDIWGSDGEPLILDPKHM